MRRASVFARPRAPFWARVAIAAIALLLLVAVLQGLVMLTFWSMYRQAGGLP